MNYNLLCYRDMNRGLGADQPVYRLQPARLDGKQKLLNGLSAMAAVYVDAVCKLNPAGPYRIGGTSFGRDVAS